MVYGCVPSSYGGHQINPPAPSRPSPPPTPLLSCAALKGVVPSCEAAGVYVVGRAEAGEKSGGRWR